MQYLNPRNDIAFKKIIRTILMLACISIFCVFIAFSGKIDAYLAFLPYDVISNKFYGETHLWCKVVYFLVPVIVVLIIIFSLFILFFYKKLNLTFFMAKRFTIIILLSLSIGPGLITNAIFKDNWGRPRPYQVIRDGAEFRPVYRPDFGASQNNSFPCGHATVGFFLGIPLLVIGRRKCALITSFIGGAFVGLVRFLQGGHYLTDIIFSGIIVWMVAEIIIYVYDKYLKAGLD